MAIYGYYICWPETTQTGPGAYVSRSLPDQTHKNTLVLRSEKVYVYWVSPQMMVPSKNWRLHAASVRGRDQRFDPKGSGVQWEHFTIADDGLVGLQFASDRTYLFYFTPEEASEDVLKKQHCPWECLVYRPEDKAFEIRVLFAVLPFPDDRHGDDYAADYKLSDMTGIAVVFNTDEHKGIIEDAPNPLATMRQRTDSPIQYLVDTYALNGLIDGGAMIFSDGGKLPVDQWGINLPRQTGDDVQPYGTFLLLGTSHWHYLIPESGPQGPWTAEGLRAAIKNGQAAALSVGQIVMLAGDFIDTFEQMSNPEPGPPLLPLHLPNPVNLAKGVEQGKPLACMVVDAALLPHSGLLGKEKAQKDFMEEVSRDKKKQQKEIRVKQVQSLMRALKLLGGKTGYSEIHALAQLTWRKDGTLLSTAERLLPWADPSIRTQLAKDLGGSDQVKPFDNGPGFNEQVWSIGVTQGRFAKLALENTKHFSDGEANWKEFEKSFREALTDIDKQIADRAAHPIPAKAIAKTAFGLHFLTDSFSSGHMRVPRGALGTSGAIAAKLMHDLDGFYGLLAQDGFGNVWRSFGDGFLYEAKLTSPQTTILSEIDKKKGERKIDTKGDATWFRVRSAAGAAFKMLHYHAQAKYAPPDELFSPKGLNSVLQSNRGENSLLADDVVPGDPNIDTTFAKTLSSTIDDKVAYIKKFYPKPLPVGARDDVLKNHPPLLNDDGSVNSSANAYYVHWDWGIKPLLRLNWHNAKKDSIEVNPSEYYFLAKYTTGAHDEGWIDSDEMKLASIIDQLPKSAPSGAAAPPAQPQTQPIAPPPLPAPIPAGH